MSAVPSQLSLNARQRNHLRSYLRQNATRTLIQRHSEEFEKLLHTLHHRYDLPHTNGHVEPPMKLVLIEGPEQQHAS